MIKQKIKEHYDFVSPYYQKLWGNHIHHGYYTTGDETKEDAQEKLIKLLINKAQIKKGSKVLDIGCGIGATSIYLSKNYNCKVKGITISPKQIEMARTLSSNLKPLIKPDFEVGDANNLNLKEQFDIIWSVEMISHLEKRKEFLKKCAHLLKKEGRIIIADWFKKENLNQKDLKKFIRPIDSGMLVSLWTSKEYRKILSEEGLELRYYEDISENVKKTWDICLKLIKKKEFWDLAMNHSRELIKFLKSFSSMKKGYETKNLKYEVIIFSKT